MHRAGCEEVNYNPACKPGREGGGRAPLAQGRAHPVRFPPPRCRLALRSPVPRPRCGTGCSSGAAFPSRFVVGPGSAAPSRDMRSK